MPCVTESTWPTWAVPEITGRTVFTGGIDCTIVVSVLTAMLLPFAFVSVSWKRSVRSPTASAAVIT